MANIETEDRVRLKRLMIEQAVSLAMQSRWGEAAEVNRQLVKDYPKEVEAYNRLGKALMEVNKYDEAREAYNHALRLEPTNTIAQKNIQKLDTLTAQARAAAPTGPVDPSIFIAETGRAAVTSLVEIASSEVLATVDAGDPVSLDVQDSTVLVKGPKGDVLGKLEPKLRQRLIHLVESGNQYAAVVTGADELSVRIIIRETHRDPSMGDRPSFPTTGEGFRGYTRDTLIRYDVEDEEDEDEDEETEELEPAHEHDVEPDLAAHHDVLLEDEPPVPIEVEDDEP